MATKLSFTLNDQPVQVEVDSRRKLLWVLRTELGLTGAKYGCGDGKCRACTVLVNEKRIRACQVEALSVRGKRVTTIEGLEKDGELHPLQKAFMANDALQCGFCTPGMILSAYGLLRDKPQPTRDEIVNWMNGNLCRCGAHPRIIDAIEAAATEMQ